MQLVSSLTSPFVRKCRILIAEKGHSVELVDGFAEQRKVLDRVNPLGKVPCLLLDDGTSVYDSAVICEYLDEVLSGPRLVPSEARARMQVRRWEALADGIADAAVLMMFERRKPEDRRDQGWLDAQSKKVRRGLEVASAELVGRAFAHGDAFSLADAAMLSAVGYVDFRVPDQRDPGLSALAAWFESHAARPSVASTAPPRA